MGQDGWYKLPHTEVEIPMPASDLVVALIIVVLFIPVVVITSRTCGFLFGGSKRLKRERGWGLHQTLVPVTNLLDQRENTRAKDVDLTGRPWYNELKTPANMVSLARALSGPVVADLIVREAWPAAVCLLAVSGASDWLDGYLARKHGQNSVLGSYLDPFADKVLIGCTVGALMYKGMFPWWLGVLVVGRDVVLVGTSVVLRFKQLGWTWPGADAFFKSHGAAVAGPGGVPVAPQVEPLMISKANTVLQLVLLACCMSRPLLGWPDAYAVDALTTATAITTVASTAAYFIKMVKRT